MTDDGLNGVPQPLVLSDSPKHLRTGLNCVMADVGSLGRLFIAKGLITEDEYQQAVLEGMRAEVAAYEARIGFRLAAKHITLG